MPESRPVEEEGRRRRKGTRRGAKASRCDTRSAGQPSGYAFQGSRGVRARTPRGGPQGRPQASGARREGDPVRPLRARRDRRDLPRQGRQPRARSRAARHRERAASRRRRPRRRGGRSGQRPGLLRPRGPPARAGRLARHREARPAGRPRPRHRGGHRADAGGGHRRAAMTTAPRPSREIDGKGRTVRELLAGRKYSIDYYQREYKWQQKQLGELIDDLAAKFLESHEAGNERSTVADYGHYFLGSIIVSDKDGQKFIIDGQQRLTTLTLLLIFLHHRLDDTEQKGQIADLIFSQKYGKRSFNLDIPERAACMEALYKGEEFADPDPAESIANILARYAELEDLFPDELAGPALPYFVDWLVENVHLVEITAYS